MNSHWALWISLTTFVFLTAEVELTKATYSMDCMPDQMEMDFTIIATGEDVSRSGHGRIVTDYKERNISVMNLTIATDGATRTVLEIDDRGANRTYLYNVSTDECSIEENSVDYNFTYVTSAHLGAGSDKLEVLVFESNSGSEKLTTVISKQLCIPIRLTSESAYEMTFFNATIGITHSDAFHIPEKCKGLH